MAGTQQSSTDASSLTTSTQSDTQVTTVVQQIDAQGPVVVDRISTQFADVACNEENARKLVEALHNGGSVTLTGNDGKTATFTPSVNLGYGEAYIALSLAAEALRNAGVTGCATPDQWQAVLLGGPLNAAGTSISSTSSSASASSSSDFPGVLALRNQGQGWGQIAQTTNVQLGQVVSSAHTSLNIDASTGSDTSLSPTGRSSAEMNASGTSADTTKSAIPGAQSSASSSSSLDATSTSDFSKDKSQGKDESDDSANKDRSSSIDGPGNSSATTPDQAKSENSDK